MKTLITGGLGFIGSHLEPILKLHGHEVYITDRTRINRKNYLRGDICDYSRMEQIFEEIKPDLVVHLAAMVSRKESEETPFMAIQTNVDGTLNIAKLAQKYKCRIIYSGSSEEYGTAFNSGIPVTEETPFGYPTSIYSMTKRMSEEIIQYFAEFKGVTATTIRFFMLYGPGENPNGYRSAMIQFIDAAICGTPLIVHKGTERQWCYITDAIEAVVLIVERKQQTAYEVFNIGSEETITTENLAYKIGSLTGSKSDITLIPPEETIIPVKLADFTKSLDVLGWMPKTTLDIGIRKIIKTMYGK